jgi:hypothetical protein
VTAAEINERTIVLPRAAFFKLREGRATVAVPDSEGQRVFLFAKRVWPSDRVPGPRPAVVLTDADLDLIGSPEGLVCSSPDGAASWLIRVADAALRACDHPFRSLNGASRCAAIVGPLNSGEACGLPPEDHHPATACAPKLSGVADA